MKKSNEQTDASQVPDYLMDLTVSQNHEQYTPREHATWRFILRQSRAFLKTNAHSVYMEGLKKTGISITRIPKIEDISAHLSQYGWSAVPVRGFIPPMAFLDLQSKQILPIAADMRTLENISYTPSPDIVHEAAGHAPILADKTYREYLCQYASIAKKAIFSDNDLLIYEAIRKLSDMKENPKYSSNEIAQAEKNLKEISKKEIWISEANEISRIYWWTAEYGLVGNITHPKIYGAGLLSSLQESQTCINFDFVKKKPLTLDCKNQSYNITEPQPQLYVTPNFEKLKNILGTFEKSMGFYQGGKNALEKAKLSKTCTTSEFDTQLSISGIVKDFNYDNSGNIKYIWWTKKAQIGYLGKKLPNHGHKRHPEGLSTPIGLWKNIKKCPSDLNDKELKTIGIECNQNTKLIFESGICVEGVIKNIHRCKNNKIILITWDSCTVYDTKTQYFNPSWGEFDMPIITKVCSVYGGALDPLEDKSNLYPPLETTPKKDPVKNKNLQSLYVSIAKLRESHISEKELFNSLKKIIDSDTFANNREWLLELEILELAHQCLSISLTKQPWCRHLKKRLSDKKIHPTSTYEWIQKGLKILAVPD